MYYLSTMKKKRKTNCTFSLSLDAVEKLEKESAKKGIPKSNIVEQLILNDK